MVTASHIGARKISSLCCGKFQKKIIGQSMFVSVVLSNSEFSNARKLFVQKLCTIIFRSVSELFGHLECDLIVGNRSDDDVILNIVERKTRYSFVYRLPNKEVRSVMKAFDDFKNLFGESFDKVFHTITTDNGSEFSHGGKSQRTFSQIYSEW